MTLCYKITKEDYLHYIMYAYDHNKMVAKQILFIRLIYSGLILLASIVILRYSLTDTPRLIVITLWITSAILIVNARRGLRKTNEKQYRKQIEAGTGAEFLGEYTLRLTDERMILSLASRTTELTYDAVTSIGQDPYGIYIFCGSLSAIPIPRTAFQEEGRQSDFLSILAGKCDCPS